MERVHHKLSQSYYIFLKEFENYLNTNFYFYGSILRNDYISGKSDIDVDIFSDNEDSTISKMSVFLNIPKKKFKKIIWRSNISNRLIYAHKVVYYSISSLTQPESKVEFSIYNEKNKQIVLQEHLSKSKLPIYTTVILWILKILFYHLQLISLDNYRFLKHNTLSIFSGIKETDFVKI